MEIDEILRQLEKLTSGSYPREAVAAAIARKQEITPELLRILETTIEQAEQLASKAGYMAHLYAMFLLAQVRETRAYPLLLRFALLPGDLLESLCGDVITEDLGRILASVCGGDARGIQSLIENEGADEWARVAGLSSLVTLVTTGQKTREEIVDYFAGLFRGGLAREWSHVWDSLVAYAADLYPEELIDDIKQAYNDGLVDEAFVGLEDIRKDLEAGRERALARLAEKPQHHLVEDAAAEMGWWDCFQDHVRDRANAMAQAAVATSSASPAPAVSQMRYSTPKPGRNDPCPCGSGRKYKKCCGKP